MILYGVLLVMFATVLGSFGSLLLKLGSKEFSFNLLKILKNKQLILGFVLYALSTLPFIISLKFGPLSVMYPFVSLSYVWVALLSVRYLNERMNLLKWLGIILILMGVSFIGVG